MSQFLKHTDDYESDTAACIDFSEAVRLPGGGSTSDIYRTRWHRHEVFVKRLKEEYRDKPLYLDALDKEYEIGVRLRHPSLPTYREFHRDYIVMDYIDGCTLAELIRRGDPWLSSEKNVLGMLRELIQVVDYLHIHNVVHCDIKPDNIMITGHLRNLVLIDLDKCYTDALNDTSGHPAKYDLPACETGNVALDLRDIGKVVESLKAGVDGFKFRRYRAFVKACNSPEANIATLAAIVDYDPSAWRPLTKVMALTGGALVILAASLILLSDKEDEAAGSPVTKGEPVVEAASERLADSTRDMGPTGMVATETATEERAQPNAGSAQPGVEGTTPVIAAQATDTPGNDDYRGTLEQLLRPVFGEMTAGLESLESMRNDTTLSGEQLRKGIKSYEELEAAGISRGMTIVSDLFPECEMSEVGQILSSTSAYKEYIRRSRTVKKAYWREAERRAM